MTEPIREADQGQPPVVEDRVDRKALPPIEEEFNDAALLMRTNVVSISAKFGFGTEEHRKERNKLEKFIRLLTQQHLKSLAHCIKLLVVGIVKGKTDRAIDTLKVHLGTLMAGQVQMAEERNRILKGEEPPVLVEPTPELVVPTVTPQDLPGPMSDGHTEDPVAGTD